MAPGGAVQNPGAELPQANPAEDPWFDPALPEVDAVAMGVSRLDDQRLQELATGSGSVLPEVERHLQEQSQFDVVEGLDPAFMAMPAENLADPMVPMRQQWESTAVPHANLMSLASPDNGPLLYNRVRELTGRDFGEFTRQDVLDGIDALGQEGIALLPNRAGDGVQLFDVNAIQVDPGRFQFKQGVNAQGQQIGNSLQGVSKWSTDAEGVVQVWTDPTDGQTFVVNGHNRLAKAKELGVPSIRVEELPAGTAEQARAMGAISNIASGGGTAFDAAKFIREAGIQDAAQLEASGIPLSSGLGTQGLALSKLPDNLLQSAIDGDLSLPRALALGGSGLDGEKMNRVYQLAQGRDMTDRAFSELAQMASSAPKVKANQKNLFGDEEIDTTVIKAELAGKIRAELIGNKNLFKRVGRGRSVKQLADKGGTEVNAQQVIDAAGTAQAVLGEFDASKYAAGTPISQMLNEAAAQVANGAKSAPIVKRILQQLEAGAEAMPPAAVEAPAVAPVEQAAPEQQLLTDAQRKALKNQVIQKAVANGEVRPSATSIPELPARPLVDPAVAAKDLEANGLQAGSPGAQAIMDEIRLGTEYAQIDARRQFEIERANREAMGYDLMPFEEKKANGMLEGWDKPDPVTLDERAAYAKQKRVEAEQAGDDTLAREWRNAERQLEQARIARTIGQQNTSQQDMFGVGQYDTSTPLLNQPPAPSITLDPNANPAKTARQLGEFNRGRGRWGITEQQWLDIFKRIGGVPDWFDLAGGQANWEKLMQGMDMPELEAKIQALASNSAPAERVAKPPAFTFPADLSKSAPRYGSASLKFANDLDRAAYMLRNASKKSAGEGRLVAALEQAGFDVAAVRRHGVMVNQQIKAQVKAETGSAAAPVGKQMTVQVADQGFGGEGMVLQSVDPIRQKKERAFLMLGNADLRIPPQDKKLWEGALDQIIRDVAGEHVAIGFEDVLGRKPRSASWGGGTKPSVQGGRYELSNDLIVIQGMLEASPDKLVSVAHHEAFHRVQFGLMNLGEMKAMETAFGRQRIFDYSGIPERMEIATIERMTVAYQTYAEIRMQGFSDPYGKLFQEEFVKALDSALPKKDGKSWGNTLTANVAGKVLRAFDKMQQLLERFTNYWKGNGFTSAEDFFRQVYEGDIARKREFNAASEVVTKDQASRMEFLDKWTTDNEGVQMQITNEVAGLDAQIAALKSKALSGGC
jgi:hypothetical protein